MVGGGWRAVCSGWRQPWRAGLVGGERLRWLWWQCAAALAGAGMLSAVQCRTRFPCTRAARGSCWVQGGRAARGARPPGGAAGGGAAAQRARRGGARRVQVRWQGGCWCLCYIAFRKGRPLIGSGQAEFPHPLALLGRIPSLLVHTAVASCAGASWRGSGAPPWPRWASSSRSRRRRWRRRRGRRSGCRRCRRSSGKRAGGSGRQNLGESLPPRCEPWQGAVGWALGLFRGMERVR